MIGKLNYNFDNCIFNEDLANVSLDKLKDLKLTTSKDLYRKNTEFLIEYHEKMQKLNELLFSSPFKSVQTVIKDALKELEISDVIQYSQRYTKEIELLLNGIANAKDIRKYKNEFLKFRLISSFHCYVAKKLEETLKSNTPLSPNAIKEIRNILSTFNEMISLRNIIVKSNIKLVFNIAKKFCKKFTDKHDDIVQTGIAYLIRSIDFFNPKKGFKASTYFTISIRNRLISTLAMQKEIFTQDTSKKIKAIRKASMQLEKELKRKPHDEEIRIKLGFNKTNWNILQAKLTKIFSLDDTKASQGVLIDKKNKTPYELACIEEKKEFINEVLSYMYPKDAKILREHFGLDGDLNGASMLQCAINLNLTRERIRQMKVRGLSRFKIIAQALETKLSKAKEYEIINDLKNIAKRKKDYEKIYDLHFVQRLSKKQIAKTFKKGFIAIDNLVIEMAKKYALHVKSDDAFNEAYLISLRIDKENEKRNNAN